MTKTVEELEVQLEKALASISKLETKNEEVIGKLKAETARADKAEEDAETAADTATNAAGSELSKLQREFTKLQRAHDTLVSERDNLSGELRSTRVDGAISAAIASGNVRPEMVDAVEAILHRKAQYEDGNATIDGKSIADWTKSYLGKEGLHFVRAADTVGTDAPGNTGAKTADYLNEPFNLTKCQAMMADNPEGAKAWAAKNGMNIA